LQINRDRSLTDVALTITHLLEKNLVTTYEAENILWDLLRSVYLYEVEEVKYPQQYFFHPGTGFENYLRATPQANWYK
jgi:hypothetical protein